MGFDGLGSETSVYDEKRLLKAERGHYLQIPFCFEAGVFRVRGRITRGFLTPASHVAKPELQTHCIGAGPA